MRRSGECDADGGFFQPMYKWYGLAALFALAEIGARVRHQGESECWMDEGLRPAFRDASTRLDGERCVIVIGDSIAYGEGVAESEACPNVLAKMLSEAYPERQITVLNAGIRGQTVLQGWARLERHVLRLRPRLVIVAFGLNDASLGQSPLDAWREHDFWQRRRLGSHRALRWSHVLRAGEARARRWRCRRFLANARPMPQRTRVSAQAFRTCLTDMLRRLRSSCMVVLATTTPLAPFALAHLPAARRERQFALYREYDDIVREVARSEETALAAMRQRFQLRDHEGIYAPDGIHLTSKGHVKVAQVFFPLVESILQPGRAQAR